MIVVCLRNGPRTSGIWWVRPDDELEHWDEGVRVTFDHGFALGLRSDDSLPSRASHLLQELGELFVGVSGSCCVDHLIASSSSDDCVGDNVADIGQGCVSERGSSRLREDDSLGLLIHAQHDLQRILSEGTLRQEQSKVNTMNTKLDNYIALELTVLKIVQSIPAALIAAKSSAFGSARSAMVLPLSGTW